LKIDAGKFITPVGYEVIEGYDGFNDNYSRSFLFGYGIPFTHTGIKVSYSLLESLNALFFVANGWDNSIDNNRSKTVCGQIGVAPVQGMNLSTAVIYGPEKLNNDADNRMLIDITGTYAVSNLGTIGINADYGSEEHSSAGHSTSTWFGVAGYLRLAVTNEFALCLRSEQFEDRNGIRTGIIQTLREVTFTPEYRFVNHLVVRGEARIDKSDRNVFQKRGSFTDAQPTVAVDVLVTF